MARPMRSPDDRRGRILATASYFASVGLIGLVGGSVGPTLAPLAAQTGIGLSTIGVALSARSFGYLIGAVGAGRRLERRNAHRAIAFALLAAGVALSLIPVARSLASLLPIMVVLGCMLATLDVGTNTLLLRRHGEGAAPYLNALHFSYGLGALAAPFLVAAVATPEVPLSWTYWTLAVVPVPVAFVLFRVPPPPRQSPADGRDGTPAARVSALPTAIAFLYGGAEAVFTSWLYTFVDSHAGAMTATNISGASWAAFSLFRLAGVVVARRATPSRILVVDYVASLLFVVPLLALPGVGWAMWIGAAGVCAAIASIYPTTIILFSRGRPLSARFVSTIIVASCLGSMVFPWLTGRLLPVSGPVAVPAVTVGLLVVAFAGTLGYLAKQRTSSAISEAHEA
ncbi:MAG: MFS transporter [Candidatus Bipolaricaulis sp.]|nr:MFS transporter [Candidatus Bipolaricaulis sp.]